jgi:hypothetical protein
MMRIPFDPFAQLMDRSWLADQTRISLRLTRSFFAPEAVSFQTPTSLFRNITVRRSH